MNVQNPNCDGDKCKRSTGEVRRLPIGGGNAHLCRDCFIEEMMWRADRNAEHVEKLDLLKWEDLEVYATDDDATTDSKI